VTRAVVFAYSEVGVRCVRELLAQGVEIPLLFTHADDPGEVHWFENDSPEEFSFLEFWAPPPTDTVWTVTGDRCTWAPAS